MLYKHVGPIFRLVGLKSYYKFLPIVDSKYEIPKPRSSTEEEKMKAKRFSKRCVEAERVLLLAARKSGLSIKQQKHGDTGTK